ncbi:MAG: ABC transporter substrate-binding protein [Deltaproteobacteria bacterium]|nr:ABC transporter substrate-binding protein [Deltaproteobacteria bacterium]
MWIILSARSGLVLFFFLLLLEAPADSVAKENLIVGYQSLSLNQSALWVAKDKGIFEKYGQDVQLVFLRSGTSATQALIAGDVHISNIGGPPFVHAVSRGASLVMVASVANRLQFQFYGAPGVTPKTLKGGRVAIGAFGGGADLASKIAVKKLGLDVNRDVAFMQLGTTSLRFLALRSGQVQAAAILPPDTFLAKKEKLPLLLDLAESDVEFLSTGLVTSRAFIKARRQTVMNFVKAYIEGLAFLTKQKNESLRILLKYLRTSDVESMSDAYDYVVGKTMPRKPYPGLPAVKAVFDALGLRAPEDSGSFLEGGLVAELDNSGFITKIFQ